MCQRPGTQGTGSGPRPLDKATHPAPKDSRSDRPGSQDLASSTQRPAPRKTQHQVSSSQGSALRARHSGPIKKHAGPRNQRRRLRAQYPARSAQDPGLSAQDAAPRIQSTEPRKQRPAPGAQHPGLRTLAQRPGFSTQDSKDRVKESAPRTQHPVRSTQRSEARTHSLPLRQDYLSAAASFARFSLIAAILQGPHSTEPFALQSLQALQGSC